MPTPTSPSASQPSQPTYTYRAGKRVELKKEPDRFVVRALPEELIGESFAASLEQVSAASSRVTTKPSDLETAMASARKLAPTHHAYRQAESGQEFLITDRVLITFRPGTSAQQIDELVGRYALVKLKAYSDRDFLFQLTNQTGMNPVKLIVALNEKEAKIVEAADHDLNQRVMRYQLQLPTDPRYASQWHLHQHLIDPDFDTRSCARCEEAWQLLDNFGRSEVVVCVTDDGCKLDHGDFGSPNKWAGWGYMEGLTLRTNADVGADPDKMYQDGSDHGTSCNGVVAANADALLTVGAAPGCRLLPIKWESDDDGLYISDTKLMTVLTYVGDKVDVVSNSWGSTPEFTVGQMVINKIKDLAATGGRRGNGIVFLWAAGNENCPIQHTSSSDIPFTNGWDYIAGAWQWVGVQTSKVFNNNLVGIPGVMHIAALASTNRRSHYSNYGAGMMLCAATNNVHKYWRLTVQGLGIVTTTGEVGGVTEDFGGTSSATPLVAGVAALVISANPQLSAMDVISVLKRTASKDLTMTPYAKTPPASYDPNPTWDISPVSPFSQGTFSDIGDADGTWSPWFGFGRLDAREAVAEAQRLAGGSPGNQPVTRMFSSDRQLLINDNQTVEDVIDIPDSATVQNVTVNLDIEHTWIGDLKVSVVAPDGKTVFLHDRGGGSSDNIQKTFDASTTPKLDDFKSIELKGKWTLRVEDRANADVGIVHHWGLQILA